MFFDLINTPAIFQLYINRILIDFIIDFIDIYCVIYLDDIFIYFINPANHQRHIREILKKVRNFKFYLKLSKCEFSVDRVKFFNFIIITRGIDIEGSKVEVIIN